MLKMTKGTTAGRRIVNTLLAVIVRAEESLEQPRGRQHTGKSPELQSINGAQSRSVPISFYLFSNFALGKSQLGRLATLNSIAAVLANFSCFAGVATFVLSRVSFSGLCVVTLWLLFIINCVNKYFLLLLFRLCL